MRNVPRTIDTDGVGLDFGTTNSVAAIVDDLQTLRTQSLVDRETKRPHPSVVWYRMDESARVGRYAKQNILAFSEVAGNAFVSSVKRKLGKEQSFTIFGRKVPAWEVAAEIFKFLLADAR